MTQHNNRYTSWSAFAWMCVLTVLALLVWLQGTSQAADIVRVKVKQANLRSGPGTNYTKTWTAPMNYPYQVLERQGKWLKVRDFSGYEDWLYAPLTDHAPAVIVKVKHANIRQGSSTRHEVAFTAYRGVPFRVLDKKGTWLKIRHEDGDEGWIFSNLVWGAAEAPNLRGRPGTGRATGTSAQEVEGNS